MPDDFSRRRPYDVDDAKGAARAGAFYITVAGPDVTPYPSQPANVYYARRLADVTYDETPGLQVLNYSEQDRYDYVCNLEASNYIPEGSIVWAWRANGRWWTVDKTESCGTGPIYAMGGAMTDAAENNQNANYNPTSDTWKLRAYVPSPTRRSHAERHSNASQIAVFGGSAVPAVRDVDQYDNGGDAWSALTDLPSTQDSTRAVGGVVGGDGYLVNGDSPKTHPRNTRYTFVSDSYASRAAPSNADLGLCCGWSDGDLVYAAVRDQPSLGWYRGELGVYSPGANAWTNLGELPADFQTGSSGLDEWDFRLGASPWVPEANVAYVISGAVQNGRLGGWTPNVLKYTVSTNTWSSAGSIPSPARSDGACASSGGIGYMIGGVNTGNVPIGNNTAFNGATWTAKTPLPSPTRWGHTATSL